MKKMLAVLLAAGLLAVQCACAAPQGETTLPTEALRGLGAVTLVAREEGSGTRSAFAELAGFAGSDAQRSDLTADTAVIAESAGAVLDAVAADKAAVGYLSAGALDGRPGIKVLAVNGASLEAGNYPLRRSFYLAYVGGLDDLQEDFLRYVRTAGQQTVALHYGAVAKSGSFLSNRASGTLTLQGSTSMAPLMETLAAEYMACNPDATVTVTATDSTDGLNAAMQGRCSFGMSSRALKEYERELLNYDTIAEDAIAVVVNAENPLTDLTAEALARLYTGEAASWDALQP